MDIVTNLLTNSLFYFAILSVVVLFYGIDTILVQNDKKKVGICLLIFGLLSLVLIFWSVSFRLNSFENISFENVSEHIEILENFANNDRVKFSTRIDSAQKGYTETGRTIKVLNEDGKLVQFLPSPDILKERAARVEENNMIIKNIEGSKLGFRIILGTIIFASTLASAIVVYRYRQKGRS